MIKLLVTDLDGCISHPFKSPDWEAVSEIKKLNEQSVQNPLIPSLTICTGRPYPYAEAVAQWLGVNEFIIFETGAGIYHPQKNILYWSDLIYPAAQQFLHELKLWAKQELLPQFPGSISEFTKRFDVGVVSPNKEDILAIYQIMLEKTKINPDIEVHHTDVSVNVIYKYCNKGTGLKWLSEVSGISTDEMAYVGDGMNDVPALKIAKTGFAPDNAYKDAKEVADFVLKTDSTQAVLQAYRHCVEWNVHHNI